VFFLNALSFVGVLGVLFRWRRRAEKSTLPAEDVVGAMRAGIRYVRHAAAVRAVLLRTAAFILGGSALWALLPSVAREELRLSATGYGLLLGCLGAGAVGGAVILPRLQERFSTELFLGVASVLFAAATVAPVLVANFPGLCAAMLAGGVAWITLMSTFSVAAQMSVPRWIRARALALYGLTFQGGTAIGSALWGLIAERAGVSTALVCGASTIVLGLAAVARYRITPEATTNLAPSFHWPDPILAINPSPEAGPVLVTVEYTIEPPRVADFVSAMKAVRTLRLRDGAYRWGLFCDPVNPARCLEIFVVESWAEHLRQHERVTLADKQVEDIAYAFHVGDRPPLVSHLIYARGDWPSG
jgi:MFS family permease